MAFDAGAAVGKMILDGSQWTAQSKSIAKETLKMNVAFQAATKVVGAIGNVIKNTVLDADKFQKSFANVATLVDANTVNLGNMRKELLQLDSRLGSATDLTEGLYQAISASVDPAKAVEFVGEAAQFARAALVDTNTAVDVITTGLNAYGLEADQAGKVSDILFNTIRRGKTTGAELSATIGQIIPLASNMNLSFENLGASIATMTRQGINSAESTTQLQAVMTSLLKPSGELADAMKSAGFETGEAVTSSDNFQEALQKVIDQTDGSQEALAALFPNVRALRGAIALTGAGASGFADDLESMATSSGSTAEAFDKQQLTFETLQNTFNKISITIGSFFLPLVYTIVEALGDFAEKTLLSTDFATGLEQTLGFLVGTAGLVKDIVFDLASTIGENLVEELGFLVQKTDGVTDATEGASPIFRILAGAMSIVSSGVSILIKGFGLLIKTVVNSASVIGDVSGLLGSVGRFLTLRGSAEEVSASFNALGGSIKKYAEDIVDGVGDIGRTAFDGINELFTENENKALEMQTTFEKTSRDTVNTIAENFERGFINIAGGADRTVNVVIGGFNEIEEDAEKTSDSIEEDLEDAFDLNDAFAEIRKGLSSIDSLFSAFSNRRIVEIENQLQADLEASGLAEETEVQRLERELAAAIAAGDQETAAQKEKELARAELTAEAEEKIREEKRKSAVFAKVLSIAEAIINTAKAITKALEAGPLLGPILAGVVGALGAIQIAAIIAEPIPQFADGGVAHGLSLVGEQGPELVNFGSPSRVFTNDETNSMLGGFNMQITFTGPINSEVDIEAAMQKAGRRLQNTMRGI